MTFTVEAGGRVRTVKVSPAHVRYEIAPGRFRTIPGPAIGVTMVANFPFDVTISSQGIGGPVGGPDVGPRASPTRSRPAT